MLVKKFQKLRQYRHFNKASAGIGIILFAAVGTILLFSSHAATPFASLEPEQGSRTPNATVVTDTTASSGAAVKFVNNASDPLFLNGLFPIGVWVPPSYDFQKWKDRGINTMVGVTQDFETWNAEANRLGLHMIREPRSNPADDNNEPLLLAWSQSDEPDGIYSQVTYNQIQADYNSWKSINPTRPVFINFIGGLNQFDLRGCEDKVYRSTCESGDPWYTKYVAGADWISADRYPVNDGDVTQLNLLGQMVDHLRSLAGNKPVFAFIESADIDPENTTRGPTPDELRGEIWEVIIHGVRGIWYFPEDVGVTFQYDNTPPDVAAEMTRQNATITTLSAVLQGPINPTGIGATVPAPLEVAWRNAPSGKYFFVLNLSSTTKSSQQITLTGIGSATTATVYGENRSVSIVAGKITDNFAPYAVHIYQVP